MRRALLRRDGRGAADLAGATGAAIVAPMVEVGALERVVPLRRGHHHLLLLALQELLHLEDEVLLGEVALARLLDCAD